MRNEGKCWKCGMSLVPELSDYDARITWDEKCAKCGQLLRDSAWIEHLESRVAAHSQAENDNYTLMLEWRGKAESAERRVAALERVVEAAQRVVSEMMHPDHDTACPCSLGKLRAALGQEGAKHMDDCGQDGACNPDCDVLPRPK